MTTAATKAGQVDADWTVTVTEPLPNCPGLAAGWTKLATQTRWSEWRSESEMRGKDVVVTVVPPAVEPLQVGDEHVVNVGRFLKVRCRVIESTPPGEASGEGEEMDFDATGVALLGLVKARLRFTVFAGEDGVVMARAQEKIATAASSPPPGCGRGLLVPFRTGSLAG